MLVLREDELVSEGSPQMFIKSQDIICHNLDKLVMGRGRGRPKKKGMVCKNPSDLKLGRRLLKEGNKNKRGLLRRGLVGDIANDQLDKGNEVEASKII